MASDQIGSSHNTIAAGTIIKGDINTTSDIRIDGNIEGTVFSKGRVVIGDKGIVKGEIKASNIDIMGNITGDVFATSQLCLKSTGKIHGNITTTTIVIEQNAVFNGNCKMNKEGEFASPVQAKPAVEIKK